MLSKIVLDGRSKRERLKGDLGREARLNFVLFTPVKFSEVEGWVKCPSYFFCARPRTQTLIFFWLGLLCGLEDQR